MSKVKKTELLCDYFKFKLKGSNLIFLINYVTSEDKANMVNTYLFQVHDTSAIVKNY